VGVEDPAGLLQEGARPVGRELVETGAAASELPELGGGELVAGELGSGPDRGEDRPLLLERLDGEALTGMELGEDAPLLGDRSHRLHLSLALDDEVEGGGLVPLLQHDRTGRPGPQLHPLRHPLHLFVGHPIEGGALRELGAHLARRRLGPAR
jgi:hypothetical protein